MKPLIRLADWALSAARAIYYTLRPQVVVMRGRDKSHNAILSICHVGSKPRGYRLGFPSQVLEELDNELDLGSHWIWHLGKLLEDIDCDFLLIETPRQLRGFTQWLVAAKKETFYIPFYVHASLDASDFPDLLKNNQNLKNDIRRVEKAGYSIELSNGPEQFRTFLDDYCRPYAKATRGSLAASFDYSFLCQEDFIDRDQWLLLKLVHGSEWVAGMIVKTDECTAYEYEVGLKDGDTMHLKNGALAALRWLYSQQMLLMGYQKISFMWSPPFLENGVLSSKRKYHPKLEAAPSSGLGILLVHMGGRSLSREVLLQLSMIQQEGSHLKATRCVEKPADLAGAREDLVMACHHYRGVSEFEVTLIGNS